MSLSRDEKISFVISMFENGNSPNMYLCPGHEDKNASLAINIEDDKILIHCHSGCDLNNLLQKVNLSLSDLFLAEKTSVKAIESNLVEQVFKYMDEDDKFRHGSRKRINKEGKKEFSQFHIEDGKKVWNLKGVETLPFRLPQLISAVKAGIIVFIAEGEKDVLTLEKFGLTATTNPGGANKWKASYNKYFTNANVVIIPDNDMPGKAHANNVRNELFSVVKSMKIIELPNLEEKEDVTDWLEKRGGTIDLLNEMVKSQTDLKSKTETVKFDLDDINAPLTDKRISDFFIQKNKDRVKYNHTSNEWLIWDGMVWKRDSKAQIIELAKLNLDLLTEYLSNEGRQLKVGEIKRLGSKSLINNILELSKSDERISVTETELDTHKDLINVQNGILNLDTKELIPHNSDYLLTQKIDINYNPDAGCNKFGNFLLEIMKDDIDLIEFLIRIFGMALTGRITEEKIFFFYGTGRNGKSVLINIIQKIFGNYIKTAPISTFLERTNETVPNDIAYLKGSRLVTTSEIPEKRKLNSSIIKDMTGGDIITCRKLYQEFFEFEPEFTILMIGNHKPKITGMDEGIWRRMCLIQFDYQVPYEKMVKRTDLVEKLLKEDEGILNLIVNGYQDYHKSGLNIPKSVEMLVNDYKEESNSLYSFITECCDINSSFQIKGKDLYKSYTSYMLSTNEKVLNIKDFYNALESAGYKKSILKSGRLVVISGLTTTSEIDFKQVI